MIPPDRFTYLSNTERITGPKGWKEMEWSKNQVRKLSLKAAQEIKSLNKNTTLEFVIYAFRKKISGCNCAFMAKYNSPAGNVTLIMTMVESMIFVHVIN